MIASERIDAIVKDRFFINSIRIQDTDFYHNFLCDVFKGSEFQRPFKTFWRSINTLNKDQMSWFFLEDEGCTISLNDVGYEECCALLRLLVVERFKEYCNELEKEGSL